MPQTILTDKQLSFLKNGSDAVRDENISNYRSTIKTNVNEGVPQIFSCFPDLIPYLEQAKIQDAVDPFDFGWVLSQLLTPEQRRLVAVGLLWGEQRDEESDAEFRDRLPELLEDVRKDFGSLASKVRDRDADLAFIRHLSETLRTKMEHLIETKRENQNIQMAVPVQRVVSWGQVHDQTDFSDLSKLLNAFYTSWDEGIQGKLQAIQNAFISIATEQNNVESGEEIAGRMRLHIPPSEEDIERYERVIERLRPQMEALVDRYVDNHWLVSKDRILFEAFDVLESLSSPQRDILTWDELDSQRKAEWKGQHTRIANHWSDERDPPLLTRVQKNGDRKVWEWTAFGEFVRYLWDADLSRRDVEEEGLPENFPTELLEETVAASEA